MNDYVIRPVREEDLSHLIELEKACFDVDRLSRRSFSHWFKVSHRIFLVAVQGGEPIGYSLILLYKGTRLARLYSIAVRADCRRRGIGRDLLVTSEELAAERGRLSMRLEVDRENAAAVALYESDGYRVFGLYRDYYADHHDALRMSKRIRFPSAGSAFTPIPWYRQTTEFTCGSAALMMAMGGIDSSLKLNQDMEFDIWREATTIYMTSGPGGSHPLGLALAARKRGFEVQAVMNRKEVLFVEGVRSAHKKEIMGVVDRQFRRKAEQAGIPVLHVDVTPRRIEEWIRRGLAVVVLISTYRTTGSKTPHWVTVTAVDDLCLYVHDPDPDDETQGELDCRDIPIAREDFGRMSVFGRSRLRAAVVIGPVGEMGAGI